LIVLHRAGLLKLANGAPSRVAMPIAKGILAGNHPAVLQILSADEGQKHFQDSRMFFECGLARQAAKEAGPTDVARLREALSSNEGAIGDLERFVQTDMEFHLAIARISQKTVIVAMNDALSEWLRQQRVVTLKTSGLDRVAYSAHAEIFAAIKAHDPDRAEMAMRDHLEEIAEEFWRLRGQAPEAEAHRVSGADERGGP
jgi:GntR family transcriptional repressor for pyruvate dehydrogenase complex